MRPMLATPYDPARVAPLLPMRGQPKYDGIRCLIKSGVAVSRTLKPIPNLHIRRTLAELGRNLEGLDGELFVGEPNDPQGYNKTQSAVMSVAGEPDFTYVVFDYWNMSSSDYDFRRRALCQSFDLFWDDVPFMRLAPETVLTSLEAIRDYSQGLFADNYEGVILRRPTVGYKFGRATPKQSELVKIKAWTDTEAVVTGFEELTSNQNVAEEDAFGLTKRSSHKANQVPMDTLGALLAKGEYADGTPFEVRIGSGFDQAQRQEIWNNRSDYVGRLVKFKYLEFGVKDNPRHPIFLGWRHEDDL